MYVCYMFIYAFNSTAKPSTISLIQPCHGDNATKSIAHRYSSILYNVRYDFDNQFQLLLYSLNITHTPHCVLRATKKKTITTTLKQASRFGLIHKKNMYVYVMYICIYIFTLNATVVVEDFRFICLIWVWVYRGVCIYII